MEQRRLQNVRLSGPEPPSPLLSPVVLKNFHNLHPQFGLSLSCFQNHIIPVIQSKRDLMACSDIHDPAAYLIPIISEIETTRSSNNNNNLPVPVSPHCVIVTPTLKNINHIKQVAEKISGEEEGVRILAINQWNLSEDLKEEVRKGCSILVASPQSLLKLSKEKLINCMDVKVVVIEEAYIISDLFYEDYDKLYDKFLEDFFDVIMCEFPDNDHRQTLVFSKYLPHKIQERLKEYLKQDYVFAALGVSGAWKGNGPTEDALEDLRLEDLEIDKELWNVNQALTFYKSKESECKKMLVENIKRQEDLFISHDGELQDQKVDAELGSRIWDLGPLTREMSLIELIAKKQDLQEEMEDVRKKLRGLEREAKELEIEKSKLADYISRLEYMVI